VAVPVHVAPQRRDAVDVAPALDVDELAAVGRLDDRSVLLRPALLLGEGVPEIRSISGEEVHDLGS
jgi:hypothetical protein